VNRITFIVAAALIAGCASGPPGPAPTQIAKFDLAPSGTLRVAVFTGNPVIGSRDPGGELRGTTVLLGRDLAASARVPVKYVEYAAAAKMVEDTKAWDVAVIAFDPARRNVLDFAPPHLVMGRTQFCFALPKGRSNALEYVAMFVEHAKTTGAVARAIEQSGLRGVSVAPVPK
jgi:ABC-type amino acid transport substrate-binding protein